GFLLLVAGNPNVRRGSFADRVQKKVLIARQNSKWRREFMEWKMTLLNRPIWEAVKAAAPEYDRDTILTALQK
ncbi:MAG: hypothetical protein IKF59_08225, partial [Lachnospiraceae bacterium]|nr:hypothetical protein [Lachnospiraceae bacterium]